MSLYGMFMESRPVSSVLPESPHVVVCFSWLIDGEGGLVSNRKTGNIGARFPNLSDQLRLEDQFAERLGDVCLALNITRLFLSKFCKMEQFGLAC